MKRLLRRGSQVKPACMTDEEWATWLIPIGDKDPVDKPCVYCPVAFHLAQRAAGTCDGYPVATNGRPILPVDARMARRREQWREYGARRRARKAAAA